MPPIAYIMNAIAITGTNIKSSKSTFSPFDKMPKNAKAKMIASKAAANRMIGEYLVLSYNSIKVLQKGHLMLMI